MRYPKICPTYFQRVLVASSLESHDIGFTTLGPIFIGHGSWKFARNIEPLPCNILRLLNSSNPKGQMWKDRRNTLLSLESDKLQVCWVSWVWSKLLPGNGPVSSANKTFNLYNNKQPLETVVSWWISYFGIPCDGLREFGDGINHLCNLPIQGGCVAGVTHTTTHHAYNPTSMGLPIMFYGGAIVDITPMASIVRRRWLLSGLGAQFRMPHQSGQV
jgi:hypothetical protein